MRKAISVLVGLSFLVLACTAISIAQEKATKGECEAKCKEAAALIKQVGFEAAKEKLNDPHGPFVWKDSYVFTQDLDGVMLAHPMNPKLVGKPMKGTKDLTGKMFSVEMIQLVTTKGEGWITYMWPKPGETDMSTKTSFVYRVPGENLFVGAGIYP